MFVGAGTSGNYNLDYRTRAQKIHVCIHCLNGRNACIFIVGENGEAQNETPSESDKMDISEVSDQVSPVSDQSEMVDNQRPAGAAQPVLLDNASAIAASPLASMMTTTTTTKTTGSTGGTTRGRLSSTLSLEGLDLELPSLDMYQEEYAEFPSSPKHLKERLEAHGLSMPLERDSGTTVDSAIQDADVNQVTLSENETQRSRRVLTPNPEDALLPALYGAMGDSTITVQSTTENDVKSSTNEGTIGNKSNVSHRGGKLNEDNNKRNMLLNVPVSDLLDEEDKSSFVFERRDSKRLTRKELGERIMEGLFVESRQKDQAASSGLRKISVPKDFELYASPTVEFQNSLKFEADVFQNPENEVLTNLNGHAERRARSQPNSLNDSYSSHEINGFGSHSDETNSSALKPQPAARKAAPPVPAARTSVSLTTPPCPKPRRKYEAARGLCLILDPAALESRTPRAVPKINPDGSVEVQEGLFREV